MTIPPFHSVGDPNAHFFALAYAVGFYGNPPALPDNAAFHVLQFSLSKGFTQFSFKTISASEGDYRAYSRGIEELSTPEFAILEGWLVQRIPPHAWKLYPLAGIDWTAFDADPPARCAYEGARRRLCHILRISRALARIEKQFPNHESGFRVGNDSMEIDMEVTPEDREIRECLGDDPAA